MKNNEEMTIEQAAAFMAHKWLPMMTINAEAQTMLSDIHRWKNFFPEGWQPPQEVADPQLRVRLQSVQAHSAAMPILCEIINIKLEKYLPVEYSFDYRLLLTALSIHDWPEGIRKLDIPYPVKTAADDAEEYKAFEKYISILPSACQVHFSRCMLLQFVFPLEPGFNHYHERPDKWKYFESEAQQILLTLFLTALEEAKRFAAVEHLEYFLFALEQYVSFKNEDILKKIAFRHGAHLDWAAEVVPGFKEEIWTPDISRAVKAIASKFEG